MRALWLLFVLLFALPLSAEGERETYTRAQFASAAADIRRAPLGPTAKQSCHTVLVWTAESPLVEILFTPAVLAIGQDKGPAGHSLFHAYAAGQALAQLRAGAKGGYASAGAKETISVYRAIQRTQPEYRNDAVEKMIAAEKDGTLEQLLAPPANSRRVPIRTRPDIPSSPDHG